MSDLISRQAAIDAVCSVCGDTECNRFDPDNKAKLYCPEPYAIMKLPPAEPDVPDTNVGNMPKGKVMLNKEAIMQAGKENREVEFRIGGRLFRVREVAQ
jgi:hypothetical protein